MCILLKTDDFYWSHLVSFVLCVDAVLTKLHEQLCGISADFETVRVIFCLCLELRIGLLGSRESKFDYVQENSI